MKTAQAFLLALAKPKSSLPFCPVQASEQWTRPHASPRLLPNRLILHCPTAGRSGASPWEAAETLLLGSWHSVDAALENRESELTAPSGSRTWDKPIVQIFVSWTLGGIFTYRFTLGNFVIRGCIVKISVQRV